MTSKTLVALQFAYKDKSLEENFETLATLVAQTLPNSIILAPELCLSGYKYEDMDKSAAFSKKIFPQILKLSCDKSIVLTLIEKENNSFFNTLYVLHNQTLIHKRAKAKLFPLGDEPKYFTSGSCDSIQVFNIDGIKIAVLICFELRFVELWYKILGADIILVPAFWGKARREHFETLTKALAITNQAFVIASNSCDEDMAASSGIITAFGEENRNNDLSLITQVYDPKINKTMRRYIDRGLL